MIAICTNQFFIVFWPRSYLYCSISIGLNTQPFQVVNYLLLATNSLRRVLFLFYLQLRLQSCTFVVSISSCFGYNSLGRDTTLRERPQACTCFNLSPPVGIISSSDVIGDLLTRLLFSPTFLYIWIQNIMRGNIMYI